MTYRETTKLAGHAAVRCERELSESRGEEVALPQGWVNLKSRSFSLDKHTAVWGHRSLSEPWEPLRSARTVLSQDSRHLLLLLSPEIPWACPSCSISALLASGRSQVQRYLQKGKAMRKQKVNSTFWNLVRLGWKLGVRGSFPKWAGLAGPSLHVLTWAWWRFHAWTEHCIHSSLWRTQHGALTICLHRRCKISASKTPALPTGSKGLLNSLEWKKNRCFSVIICIWDVNLGVVIKLRQEISFNFCQGGRIWLIQHCW